MKGQVGWKGDNRYRKPKKGGGQLQRGTQKDWRSVSGGLCCSVVPRMSGPAAKQIFFIKVSVQEMLERRKVLLLLSRGGKREGCIQDYLSAFGNPRKLGDLPISKGSLPAF